jgi:hypothetical protein
MAAGRPQPLNKSLNATPNLCLKLSPGSGETVIAFADWARVNSMLCGRKLEGSNKPSLGERIIAGFVAGLANAVLDG